MNVSNICPSRQSLKVLMKDKDICNNRFLKL